MTSCQSKTSEKLVGFLAAMFLVFSLEGWHYNYNECEWENNPIWFLGFWKYICPSNLNIFPKLLQPILRSGASGSDTYGTTFFTKCFPRNVSACFFQVDFSIHQSILLKSNMYQIIWERYGSNTQKHISGNTYIFFKTRFWRVWNGFQQCSVFVSIPPKVLLWLQTMLSTRE